MEDLKFKTAEQVMNFSNRMSGNTNVDTDFYTNAKQGVRYDDQWLPDQCSMGSWKLR